MAPMAALRPVERPERGKLLAFECPADGEDGMGCDERKEDVVAVSEFIDGCGVAIDAPTSCIRS